MRPLAAVLAFLAACSDGQGGPTGATCPTPAVTYAEFAQPFMTAYCLACHSTAKTGAARQGAPPTIDFDTQGLVRMNTSNIDRLAASGPDAENTQMPPGGSPAPSAAERARLGEYIACEVGR